MTDNKGADAIWTPYCGSAPLPHEWVARWNFDPWLIVPFGLGLLAWRAWGLPGRGRFAAGAAGLGVVLLVSPFCALTSALFSARVVHHVVLTAAVAPLLVAAFPRQTGPRFGVPLWTAVHALVFWFWHAPSMYAWALSSDAVYWLMQLSLLGSAAGFWAAVRRAPGALAIGGLLATMVQMGLLGALLTFASVPMYAPHWLSTAPWGLSPLEDQQLAGLIMWAPAGALYLAAAILLASRLFARQHAPTAS